MTSYQRVTRDDRIKIDAFLSAGQSIKMITEKLNFHRSTIYREIKRNHAKYGYYFEFADEIAKKRYVRCRRRSKFTPEIKEIVTSKLQMEWSPEQICGRIKREKVTRVSHTAIYNLIERDEEVGKYKLNRRGRRRGGLGRHSQRKAKIRNFTPISERPMVVKKRTRLGDWERDGMYIANRQQLLVMVERKSRYTLFESMGTGSPSVATSLTLKMLKKVPTKVHTITNDRGPEFRDSKSLKIPVYFCDMQKPQQRGTIENTIGLLRQYLKRSTEAKSLDARALKALQNKINLRPRKILDYKTPHEVLFKTSVALVS